MWNSKNLYTPPVRIGNWFEDSVYEEDMIKDFMLKKSQNRLLIQKSTTVREKLFQPIELSVANDGLVHFGQIIQLKNLGNPSCMNFGMPRQNCVVSANCDSDLILEKGTFVAPCQITGSRKTSPCLANSFMITSGNESDNGQLLHYNQVFYLKILDPVGGHLYLQSDKFDFTKCSERARKQKVYLSDKTMYLAKWRVLYLNQLFRLEHEFQHVCANETVIINHVYTNQNLNVEDKVRLVSTEYDVDYEVTAHTQLDSHKAEIEQNQWVITTRIPEGIPFPINCTKPVPSPYVPPIKDKTDSAVEPAIARVPDHAKCSELRPQNFAENTTVGPQSGKKVVFADEIENNDSNVTNNCNSTVAPATTPAEPNKML